MWTFSQNGLAPPPRNVYFLQTVFDFFPSYKNSQNLRLDIFVPNKLIVKPVFTVLTFFEKPNCQKPQNQIVWTLGSTPSPLLDKVHTLIFFL